MRILGIDHIGIASEDLGKHIEIFGAKLGLEVHDIEEKDPYGGLRAAFARVGDTDIEILEDRVPDGDQKVIDQRDIARFVARRGQGLHHIALRVADIDEAMRDARAAGLTVIDETPRAGARGSKIAFLHPRSTGGVLLHLVERPDQETR
jgi:methylmalonyl-CoA/ethylmalonyl-CoA epimerase